MEEPNGAVGLERWSMADSPEVSGDNGAKTDMGGAGGTRELRGAGATTVLGEAEGTRSQDGVRWSMGRGGARDSSC